MRSLSRSSNWRIFGSWPFLFSLKFLFQLENWKLDLFRYLVFVCFSFFPWIFSVVNNIYFFLKWRIFGLRNWKTGFLFQNFEFFKNKFSNYEGKLRLKKKKMLLESYICVSRYWNRDNVFEVSPNPKNAKKSSGSWQLSGSLESKRFVKWIDYSSKSTARKLGPKG